MDSELFWAVVWALVHVVGVVAVLVLRRARRASSSSPSTGAPTQLRPTVRKRTTSCC
jgi:hypothetical protein